MTLEVHTHEMAETVARRSYGKLVALLATRMRDVASAEDALSEAFAIALEDWPTKGCPANPEAWLLTVARRKMIDSIRRRSTAEALSPRVVETMEQSQNLDADNQIPDRRLALMFACAHPAIDVGVRAPLILQCVLGLDAKTISSAFLVSPTTMSKRLVRAKDKIRQAGIPFDIPEVDELSSRLESVLDAIYASYAEGWTDPGGTDMVRRDLTEEALYLARLVVQLLPNEPEALGLLSLLLHAHARRHARRNEAGEYVPFSEQETTLWDTKLILEAEELLRRASTMGSIGRYQLEAALQSAHVYRKETGCENWRDIVQLYDKLLVLSPTPVIIINRALALTEMDGAEVGLDELSSLKDDPRVMQYQPYWAARAELLSRISERKEASRAYDMAIGLERDPAVRRFLLKRQAAINS